MNWKKALLDYLTKGFTASTHKKGNKLLKELDKINFEYDEQMCAIEASISLLNEGAVFFPVLEREDFESINLFGKCSCVKGRACVHLAALTLGLLRDIREGKQRTVRLLGTDKPQVAIEPPSSAIPEEDIVRMPLASASEARKLPLEHYDELSKLLTACMPRRKGDLYGYNKQANVKQGNKLELITLRNGWGDQKEVNYKVELIPNDSGTDIVCHSCSTKTDRLCKHQYHALADFEHQLEQHKYFTNPACFDAYLTEIAKKQGFSLKHWRQFYRLEITPSDVHVRPRSNSIFPPRWLAEVLEHREIGTVRLLDAYEPSVDLASHHIGQQGYGILWYEENYEQGQDIPLRFITGEKYKSKSGINLRTIESSMSPYTMSYAAPELLMPLVHIALDTDLKRGFKKMKAYLFDNLDEINELYNYIYTGEYLDEDFDTKEAYLVKFSPDPITGVFKINQIEGYYEIELILDADGQSIALKDIIYFNNYFAATKRAIYIWENHALLDYVVHFIDSSKILLAAGDRSGVQQLIDDMERHFAVEVAEGIRGITGTLDHPRYQLYLSEVGDRVYFEPILAYDRGMVNATIKGSVLSKDERYRIAEEDRSGLMNFLKNAHPDWRRLSLTDGQLSLQGVQLIHNRWFVEFAEACDIAGVTMFGRDTLKAYKVSSVAAQGGYSIASGIEWFDVDASLSFGEEEVPMATWIQAIKEGNNYVQLKDGSYGLLPKDWIKGVQKMLQVADVEKGALKISKYRFNIIEDLDATINAKTKKELEQKKLAIQSFFENKKKQKISAKIKAALRPYQLSGFQWLKFLDDTNSGGILADDMGLGKTLQVISLLASQKSKAPSLIVVPRSLLYNWSSELDKFCPSLKYMVHHGPQRTQVSNNLDRHHLIITTYDTCVRDHDWLKEIEFNYIILDESQAIKNVQSKRYKALRHLQARNRLAMTGTPIENNTFDLYAQLSFTSPGLLGTQSSFKKNFAIPIDKYGSQEAAILLQKMIHPYVLRRTKAQVAKDLPEKVEQVLYCDMSKAQRTMYEQLKSKILMDLEAAKTKTKKGQMHFKILDGLLRLRQMCNAPYLVNKSLSADPTDAVKIKLLIEQLKSVTPNHKALVFSQFVQMLHLIKLELEKEGIPYVYLDGQTKDRQAVVDEFQDDPEIKVFLISLKAGNTGLNLTAAEYVYIVDPWWNPAVEAQAIDRTHRIGQTNNVLAYRMICRNSIEEKILELQQKKKDLSAEIIHVDYDVAKQLNENELMDLFD